MSDEKKEQLRAEVTYFNGVAVSLLAVGGFSTFLTLSFQKVQPGWVPWALAASSLVMSILVHKLAARAARRLGRLSDSEKRDVSENGKTGMGKGEA